MCIQIPSPLPPDPTHSSEPLISGSWDNSPPVGTPGRSFLAIEDPSREIEEAKGVEFELKEDSDGGGDEEEDSDARCKKVLEDTGCEPVDDYREGYGEVAGTGALGKGVLEEGDSEPSLYGSPHPHLQKNGSAVAHQSRPDPLSSGLSPVFNKLWIFDLPDNCDDDSSDNVGDGHTDRRRSPSPPPMLLWRPRSPPPLGAGLANMGNTCFLNAVMQCFTHTVPLVHGLHSLRHDVVPSHHNDGEFCVLSAVRDHIFHALATSGEVISPDNLVNNLSYISSFFQRFQQEDAHEYLQCLLDKLDTCWSKCKVDGTGISLQGDSLVKQVFGGRLVSQLYCCKCGSRSDTYEPLVDLSLEIDDVDDLDGALKSFTKMEEIEDDVKISCEKCKEQVPVKKQLLLDQAPSVAALHLKRFKGDGYFVKKVDKALLYPLELDLNQCAFGGQDEIEELKYDLYAIIVHLGFSSISGHYLCYIRSSPDKWFRIDDSKVTEVTEKVALSQQAYILFYAKKGTPWPCSLVKSTCDNGMWNTTSPKSVLDNVEHTGYPNPSKACLDDENVAKNEDDSSHCTELPLPQACDEICSTGLRGDNDEGPIPRNEVCCEVLNDGNSSPLSSAPKDDEVILIGSVDGQGLMLTNDSSRKRKDDILCNEGEGDWNSSFRPTGNEAKSCIPASGGTIEPEISGFNRNIKVSPLPQLRSSSPDIHSQSEEHPEAAHPPLKKKQKVENRSPLRKLNNRTMVQHSRKKIEALKSVRGLTRSRRQLLTEALLGVSQNEGSTSRIRKRNNQLRTRCN